MLSLDKHLVIIQEAVHLFVDLVSLTQNWHPNCAVPLLLEHFFFPSLNLFAVDPVVLWDLISC